MSQNSKWSAWQQIISEQVDEVVEYIVEFLEPTNPEKVDIDSTQTIDLEPITEEETGLEINETPYVDTVEDRQIPDISVSTSKPKKGNKA